MYVKTNWVDNETYLNAENMNHIENGIEDVDINKANKVVNGTSGNLVALDASGNLVDSDIGADDIVLHLTESEMDDKIQELQGYIVQCSAGSQNYVTGYFYKCVEVDSNFIWQRVNTQPDAEVDQHFNSSSSNPQSGTAVAEAVEPKADKSNTYTKNETDNLLSDKQDKIPGMGLSQNSFTNAEKTKLSGIEVGAQVNGTVDQNYNANSTNAQSGVAVSEAVAAKQDKFRRIAEVEISAENDNTTSFVVISEDINGQPFALKEARVYVCMPADSEMSSETASGYFNISQVVPTQWIGYGAIIFKSKTKATNNLLEIRANGDYPSCCKIYTQALAYKGATENQKLSFGINDATQVTNLSQITAFNIQLNGSYWRTGAKIIIEGIDK